MSSVQIEVALETKLIELLAKQEYQYITLTTYDFLVPNFREQIYIHNKLRFLKRAQTNPKPH